MITPMPKDLLSRAYATEASRADSPWLTQPMGGGLVKTYTWQQGFDEARRIATYLQSLGLPPGSHIALLSKNTAWWLLCDLAIWMAGHVSVPVYPTLAASSIKQILEHSGAKLIFIGKLDGWPAMKDGIPKDLPMVAMPLCPEELPTRWSDLVKAHAPLATSPVRAADEIATIVYTSGSTGTPKGVMITFGIMQSAQESAVGVFHARTDDRMISYLPLAHVFERAVVEGATLYSGFQVFFAEALETFVADMNRARPTIFVSVPRLWLKFQAGVSVKMPPKKLSLLLKIPILSGIVKKKILTGLGLDQCRVAISGSAPIPPATIAWYRNLGLELLEGYGMSENFCISHITKLGRVRPGYVGEPWPGVDVRLSPEGEVQMKCGALMKGYYNAPELTAQTFTDDGYLKTGDRGEIDELGRLKITGRVKEIFKTSKGKSVAPAPIENLLLANEFLESGCVMGASQSQPCAVVTIADAYRARTSEAELRKRISESLAKTLTDTNKLLDPHEALQVIVIARDPWAVENGILTPTMKVKRGVVEERYAPSLDAWYRSKDKVIWEGGA